MRQKYQYDGLLNAYCHKKLMVLADTLKGDNKLP